MGDALCSVTFRTCTDVGGWYFVVAPNVCDVLSLSRAGRKIKEAQSWSCTIGINSTRASLTPHWISGRVSLHITLPLRACHALNLWGVQPCAMRSEAARHAKRTSHRRDGPPTRPDSPPPAPRCCAAPLRRVQEGGRLREVGRGIRARRVPERDVQNLCALGRGIAVDGIAVAVLGWRQIGS